MQWLNPCWRSTLIVTIVRMTCAATQLSICGTLPCLRTLTVFGRAKPKDTVPSANLQRAITSSSHLPPPAPEGTPFVVDGIQRTPEATREHWKKPSLNVMPHTSAWQESEPAYDICHRAPGQPWYQKPSDHLGHNQVDELDIKFDDRHMACSQLINLIVPKMPKNVDCVVCPLFTMDWDGVCSADTGSACRSWNTG
jgi:hypothetical protein